MFLQQRGATAAPILTRPYAEVLDRIMSCYQPTEPMPSIVIEHPLQNLDDDTLVARAHQIAAYIEALLDGVD